MDIAGLTVGVVGVVGVISAFKDTIDLLQMFYSARGFDRDFDLLAVKFDIEKTLLLQWAERVKLLQKTYDARLDDENIQPTIVRALRSIETLLKDTKQLQSKYGVHHKSVESSTPNNRPLTSVEFSRGRLEAFHEQLKHLSIDDYSRQDQNDIEKEANKLVGRGQKGQELNKGVSKEEKNHPNEDKKGQGKDTEIEKKGKEALQSYLRSIKTKCRFRWIIEDKAKFETLVTDIGYLRSRLDELIPSQSNMSSVTPSLPLTQDTIEKLGLRTIMLVLQGSEALSVALNLDNNGLEAIDSARQRSVLQALHFRKIHDRKDFISEAHAKTFSWIFRESKEDQHRVNFADWLKSSEPLYWLSGKAGSGKSTLMKYLYLNYATLQQFLSSWAADSTVFCYTFFITSLGTKKQKTKKGLIRSLLYQILSDHPSWIPEANPIQWKDVCQTGEIRSRLSTLELQAALRRTLEKAQHAAYKFLFLIDGLDELYTDVLDTISFVKWLSTYDNIKSIVSSRPISSCVNALANYPVLRLQDLTKADITNYVHDTIGNHVYMNRLRARYLKQTEQLCEELIGKAFGVFLWIVLACRSVLKGLDDRERIPQLRERVREMPEEMEGMFQLMLNKIEMRHQEEAAKILRLCTASQDPNQPEHRSTLSLALLEEDYSRGHVKLGPTDLSDGIGLCDDFEGRLRSRCLGLLEVFRHFEENPTIDLMDCEVVFIHRTLFEFLSRDETWEMECLQLPKDFSVAAALSIYYAHLFVEDLQSEFDNADMDLDSGLRWGLQADRTTGGELGSILNYLNQLLDLYKEHGLTVHVPIFDRAMHLFNETDLRGKTAPNVDLLVAIELGAKNYVQNHPSLCSIVAQEPDYFSQADGFPLLLHAACRPLLSGFNIHEMSAQRLTDVSVLRVLLEEGCSPNLELNPDFDMQLTIPPFEQGGSYNSDDEIVKEIKDEGTLTVWKQILRQKYTKYLLDGILVFLEFGADPALVSSRRLLKIIQKSKDAQVRFRASLVLSRLSAGGDGNRVYSQALDEEHERESLDSSDEERPSISRSSPATLAGPSSQLLLVGPETRARKRRKSPVNISQGALKK